MPRTKLHDVALAGGAALVRHLVHESRLRWIVEAGRAAHDPALAQTARPNPKICATRTTAVR